MEHYFNVSILRKSPFKSARGKQPQPAWFRTFDSSYTDFNGALARVNILRDFLKDESGEFVDEQALTYRGGTYSWAWWNGDDTRIIEITKIDFGRVYDWDDVNPVKPG